MKHLLYIISSFILLSCQNEHPQSFELQKKLINEVLEYTFMCDYTFDYRLQFNQSDPVKEIIEYYSSNELFKDTTSFTFKEDGKLSSIYSIKDGKKTMIYEFEYDSLNRINILKSYDERKDSFQTNYISYNELGLIEYVKNGDGIYIRSYKYLTESNSNLIKNVYIDLLVEKSISHNIYVFDNSKHKNREFLIRFYSKGSGELPFEKFIFHENGKIKKVWKQTYDQHGNWKTNIRLNGNKIDTLSFETNKYKNWTFRKLKNDIWVRNFIY